MSQISTVYLSFAPYPVIYSSRALHHRVSLIVPILSIYHSGISRDLGHDIMIPTDVTILSPYLILSTILG
jgi:hypothetical protein